MNTFAGLLGWLVIWSAVAVIVAVPVGKYIAHRTRPKPEHGRDVSVRPPFGGYSDPDTLPHQRQSRYLPPSSHPDDDPEDPPPHEPAP